jgi:hypothetical protein
MFVTHVPSLKSELIVDLVLGARRLFGLSVVLSVLLPLPGTFSQRQAATFRPVFVSPAAACHVFKIVAANLLEGNRHRPDYRGGPLAISKRRFSPIQREPRISAPCFKGTP